MQTETTLPNMCAASGPPAIFRRLVRPRLVFAGLALALIGAGLAWQWGWLVAIGIAPLLISAAPCVAMCALGLCVHRMSSSTESAAPSGPSQNSSPQQKGI
jgi:hypothetical protein